jgi:hypothetical protein
MTLLPCPVCSTTQYLSDGGYGLEILLSCSNCYDADCVGDPPRYVSRSITASSVEDWNEQVLDYVGDRDWELGERGLANLVRSERL